MPEKEKVEEFFNCLEQYISDKAQDIVDNNSKDLWDSFVGLGSLDSYGKLRVSLYDLFDLKIVDSEEEQEMDERIFGF